MKKKIIAFITIIIFITAGYFVLFHKNKNLRNIPKNTDVVILVDVKNVTKHYLYHLILNPSEWFKSSDTKEKNKTIKNSGIVIPDFLSIFHLKNTNFSQWFTILEVKEKEQLLNFLKQENFLETPKNVFIKDEVFIKIYKEKCVIGIGNFKNSETFLGQITSFENFKNDRQLSANQLIDNSHGSISFFSEKEIHRFSVELSNHAIEIKNTNSTLDFDKFRESLEAQNLTLNFEFGKEEISFLKKIATDKTIDSVSVFSAKGNVNVDEVKEKMVTYGYDENFNETEKVTYQKIFQPNYNLVLKSNDTKKTWDYFNQKKWINAQNQFILIPFLPNLISVKNDEILIQSTKKPLEKTALVKKNFGYFKNNSQLFSSFKSLTEKEKKIATDLDYIFYEREKESVFLRINFNEKELPIILRY